MRRKTGTVNLIVRNDIYFHNVTNIPPLVCFRSQPNDNPMGLKHVGKCIIW